jgi:hypothetical protein
MAEKGRDPSIVALEAVYAALKDLDAAGRKKVLSSAFALLGVEGAPILNPTPQYVPPLVPSIQGPARPTGLVEIVNEKNPSTNSERIAVFAYYREKVEGLSRFSRGDLKPYFAKAKLPPAGNYDRDFGDAARRGWIHEDGSESYLTSKGIEAIESGFDVEKSSSKGRRPKPPKKARKKTRKGR